ncbi:hypothetical protein BHE90_010075 [Fusarium euwallaceae]|uniref:Chromo domain-containing protein n=1 Tax=Fusarium euwallaceae TaxID=1147111 RepID=A0A430LIE6_9HYPO|nr:hypothetical protein BHE90_010075 [Fusarium euwallaceae]
MSVNGSIISSPKPEPASDIVQHPSGAHSFPTTTVTSGDDSDALQYEACLTDDILHFLSTAVFARHRGLHPLGARVHLKDPPWFDADAPPSLPRFLFQDPARTRPTRSRLGPTSVTPFSYAITLPHQPQSRTQSKRERRLYPALSCVASDLYNVHASLLRARDRTMAIGTSTKEGDVPTVREKNGAGRKMPSDEEVSEELPTSATPPKTTSIASPGAAEQNEPKSIEERRGKKYAEANGAIPTASGSEGKPLAEIQDTRGEVDELVDHHVKEDDSTVDFKVRWKGSDETSWEPERNLQEDVPTLVYKYWDGLGGRDTATGLKFYHVFKILKLYSPPVNSKDSQYTHIVQWVGYPLTETTPECESKLRRIAPQELKKFDVRELERGATGSQKRNNSRGPGRPRKKVRSAKN